MCLLIVDFYMVRPPGVVVFRRIRRPLYVRRHLTLWGDVTSHHWGRPVILPAAHRCVVRTTWDCGQDGKDSEKTSTCLF